MFSKERIKNHNNVFKKKMRESCHSKFRIMSISEERILITEKCEQT